MIKSNFNPLTSNDPLLNIGCGRRYHDDWVNIDLETSDPCVIRHDVNNGIPFEEGRFAAVYHSHILEHLEPADGRKLIHECYRVLKPGGILRIVVPDLECIARLYLEMHQEAWMGDENSQINYNWMKLELLDQLVRRTSGGKMGRYMASREIKNSEFVKSRLGDEFSICQTHGSTEALASLPMLKRMGRISHGLRRGLCRKVVRLLLGAEAGSALDEGLFRSEGEIHRWMYDRFSLRELVESAGFENFSVCEAFESQIPDYAEYELDVVGDLIRKPDSIFIECQKPLAAAANFAQPGTSQSKQSQVAAA